MKLRIGTKPVYSARKNARHVRMLLLAKRFIPYQEHESKTHAQLESKTYAQMEYELSEV